MRNKEILAAALLLCIAFLPLCFAEDGPERSSVFDRPRLRAAQAMSTRATAVLFAQGKYADAEQRLRKIVERFPDDVYSLYNLACAQARQGKTKDALASLNSIVELRFNLATPIARDKDLESLRDDPRFQRIVEKSSTFPLVPTSAEEFDVESAAVTDGVALVSETNVAWSPREGLLRAFFTCDRQVLAAKPIARGLGPAGDLLCSWQEEGTAAGNHGDFYDNRDADHSNMKYAAFPQLTRVEYGEAARERQLHNGAQRWFRYNAVTLGNSSTAVTSGPAWRSQARLILTQSHGAVALHGQYRGNHLYMYPEHRDHDPAGDGKGHGDVFPANTPYMIISQGSSGSDKVFLNAVTATLAAFRPAVKEALAETGMLMPAVQMVFRMSSKIVQTPDDYLTGKAHPTVFAGGNVDVDKMVTLAHEIRPDALPPMVAIKVVEEDEGVVGRDYFDVAPRERRFDTPCAVSRVVKSTRYLRRMVVSAQASADPGGRPLAYFWVVLRGDAGRIRIKALNEAGSVAELLVPYHERRPVAPGSKVESSRVDIGVFVHNGIHYSAPAFVSLLYLDNELREYDDQQRIKVVDYVAADRRKRYVDPLIDLPKDWRDEYHYDGNGTLTGWTRVRGSKRERFTPDGRLVLEQEGETPAKTCAVRYTVAVGPKGSHHLKQETIEPGGQSQ